MWTVRPSRRLMTLGSLLVLLLAVLPNILYVGHIPALGGHEEPASPERMQEHAAHCHYGPSGCSDHPHPSTSSWWLRETVDVEGTRTMEMPSAGLDALVVAEASPARPERPPQAL